MAVRVQHGTRTTINTLRTPRFPRFTSTTTNTLTTNTINTMAKLQQKVITTPRGKNVGRNIIANLKHSLLLNRIDVKTIHSERDPINKSIVTTLGFTLS